MSFLCDLSFLKGKTSHFTQLITGQPSKKQVFKLKELFQDLIRSSKFVSDDVTVDIMKNFLTPCCMGKLWDMRPVYY